MLHGVLVGEVGERGAVLVEGHPEEDDDGEDKAKGHDAVGRFLLRELGLGVAGSGRGRLGGIVGMLEGAAEGVVDDDAHHEGEAGHAKGVVVGVGHGGAEVLLGVVHDLDGGRRGKEGADVDGHVEDGECGVALAFQLGVVVEVTDHDLQVALEEAGAYADHEQGGEHEHHGGDAVSGGDGEHEVAQEHDDDARSDALAVADAVGQGAAHKRQEID